MGLGTGLKGFEAKFPERFCDVGIAEEHAVDLIVIGSHGRHGLQRILGSTASGVLHTATCDVLAVRIRQR